MTLPGVVSVGRQGQKAMRLVEERLVSAKGENCKGEVLEKACGVGGRLQIEKAWRLKLYQ